MRRENEDEWPGASVDVVIRGRVHRCNSMGVAVGLLRLGLARHPVLTLGSMALDELADLIAEELKYGDSRD
jgi:hypothetical protein